MEKVKLGEIFEMAKNASLKDVNKREVCFCAYIKNNGNPIERVPVDLE